MFDELVDRFLRLIEAVPPVLTEPGSPNFHLSRAMIALVVLALIVYGLAFLPYRRMASWIRQLLSR